MAPQKSWMAAKLLLREDMAQELRAIQRAWGFETSGRKTTGIYIYIFIIIITYYYYILLLLLLLLLYIVIIRDDLVMNNTYNYIKNTRQDISVNRFITMMIMNICMIIVIESSPVSPVESY